MSTVTENNRKVCYIDDGSGLSRSTTQGLKVIYYHGDPPPIPEDGTLSVTGILGVEKDDDNPVPVLRVEPYHVGYLYSLCYSTDNCAEAYLTKIDQKYGDVTYQRLTNIQNGINNSFNVVYLALPTRSLYTSELNALSSFVQSGREKRVVLIGEHNRMGSYSPYNSRLNVVASAIGMNTTFSTTVGQCYDIYINIDRLCSVNPNHYLTTGVTNLWDAGTDKLVDGWESYARPLTYIYDPSMNTRPWILEEDTTTAGSRIAIHDNTVMNSAYSDDNDTVPNKNFKLIYNLCTIFPN